MSLWFSSDGSLIRAMTKIGNIILLNALFLLGCLPVITIGTSIIAFYYAMVKSIRRERSYPAVEFIRAYKRNLCNGIVVTLAIGASIALIYINREYFAVMQEGFSVTLLVVYDAIFVLLVLLLMFLFPVMSRFEMNLGSMIRLAFIMSIRHIPYTICLAAGFVICFALLLWVLPIPFLVVLPGIWCYISTYPVEHVLRRYMPKPKEGEDAWYYE